MDFPRWSAVVGVVIWRRCRTAFDVGALVGADKAQMESKGGRHTVHLKQFGRFPLAVITFCPVYGSYRGSSICM